MRHYATEGTQGAQHGARARGNLKAKRAVEDAEIARLEEAIAAGAPAPGSNLAQVAKGAEVRAAAAAAGSHAPLAAVRNFDQLPLSGLTLEGLRGAKYKAMTAIQRAALPHALAGRDVLGAAKTGSGKTLAFLVPAVEKLFRLRWTPEDGVGAIVITPTRELAMQIFDTLRKFAKHHALSAGLVIGGKDVEFEKEKVNGMNILIATPGRLLQHMDETPYFDCGSLSVLILDEADRILDMGFSAALNAILDFLPRTRQTLLFSATQTRRVSDLARLSLRDAEYISVHEHAAAATPPRLTQMVATVALGDKMHALWGFIKTHLTQKTLVFLSSCRQVAFVHEALRQLRPGVPLRALHGRMKQPRRMGAFYDFCNAPAMVLLATDVAARGLDFPSVDWVLQVDCPEDTAAYIHRVGRTARYTASGKALLLLEPAEQAFLPQLQAAKVPFTVSQLALGRTPPVAGALAGLLSADPALKATAQRAVTSYLRAVHVMPNKTVFDVTKMDVGALAASLGLTNAPKLRFMQRERAGQQRGGAHSDKEDEDELGEGEGGDDEDEDAPPPRRARPPQPASDEADEEGDGQDDELMAVCRADHGLSDGDGDDEETQARLREQLGLAPAVEAVSAPAKARKLKLRIKAGSGVAQRSRGAKVVFDADGTARMPLEAMAAGEGEDAQAGLGEGQDISAAVAARYAATAAQRAASDPEDKRRERELRRAKKQLRKRKLRARAEGGGGSAGATLDGGGDSDQGGDGSGEEESESEEEEPFQRREQPLHAPKRRRPEAAHAGMARATAPSSIEDLEAAALARLTGARR